MTFAALLVIQKREKKKSCFMILRGRTMFDPCLGDAVQRWLRTLNPPLGHTKVR